MIEANSPSPSHGALPLRVAVLGAECTGKSTLITRLVQALAAQNPLCVVVAVPETLRAWCAARGRSPAQAEQASIAAAQSDAIAQACTQQKTDFVVADTTRLMTAVYSEVYFSDRTLYPAALSELRGFDAVWVCAPDMPWQPDGIQRDGPLARDKVDALLRATLTEAGITFVVLSGTLDKRLTQAIAMAGVMRLQFCR